MPTTPQLRLRPQTNALAAALHEEFRERWAGLAQQPERCSLAYFQVPPVPDDLRDRRVELIVEASNLTMLRRALDSDADAVAVDFDDTFSPTLVNVQAAYNALEWVAKADKPLLARTRALYAVEPHVDFGGPGIAALCDLSAVLSARPTRPFHLYIPKLETEAEAQFWDDALAFAEVHLGLARNTVKVCLQIETFSGLLGADGLLYRLHERAYGLNAGRWDYVFSLTKWIGKTRTQPMPPRSHLTMDVDAMRAYAEHLVFVCQQRGAEAIGGTAAVFPDPADPQPALDAVLADKQREAAQGFTAAWAGLPELVGAVRGGFSGITPQSPAATAPLKREPGSARNARNNAHDSLPSKGRWPEGPEGLFPRLITLPTPDHIPVSEFQDSIGLALDVFAAWFEGRGVITRKGRIEDTATAELARALVWQWVKVGAELDDGTRLTRERYLHERRALTTDGERAARLLDHLVLAEDCPAYFPREAQLLEWPHDA